MGNTSDFMVHFYCYVTFPESFSWLVYIPLKKRRVFYTSLRCFPRSRGINSMSCCCRKIVWSSLLVADTSTFVVFWNSLQRLVYQRGVDGRNPGNLRCINASHEDSHLTNWLTRMTTMSRCHTMSSCHDHFTGP